MLDRKTVIKKLRIESSNLRANFGVKRIGIFGSFASNTQTQKSDVDIIVELEKPIGLRFFDLINRLEKVLGKRIDILTADGLKTLRVKEAARSIKESLLYV